MAKTKSIFTVILFCVLLLGSVIVPALIISGNKREERNFPGAENLVITEKTLSTQEQTTKTRKTLETESYFIKFATSPDYNYKNIRRETNAMTGLKYSFIEDGYLEKMIINFIFNYQLTNTSKLSSIDYESGYFCLTPIRVKEALEELYYTEVGMNDFIEYLPGYFDYVVKNGKDLCFNFNEVSKTNDSEILVGIRQLSVSDQKIVTADVYVYRYYTTGTDKENQITKTIKKYIEQSNYSTASDIVINNMNGSVDHRKIVFRTNKNKKYFEYQLLYSADIR